MTRRMLLIAENGAMNMVDAPDLDALRVLVRGHVERVRVGPDWAIAVNEEATLRPGFQPNWIASILYGWHLHGTPILGPAVLGAEGWVDDGIDWLDTSEVMARMYVRQRREAAFASLPRDHR